MLSVLLLEGFYEIQEIKHLHIILRAECHTSPGPQDEQLIYDKVVKLVDDIGMKVFMKPNVIYMPDVGNEGLTYVVGLETSHSAGHFWDLPSNSFMKYKNSTLLNSDIYTCGCMGLKEIQEFLRFVGEYSPKLISAKVIDRSCNEMPTVFVINYDYQINGNFNEFVQNLNLDYTEEYQAHLFNQAN